MGKGKWKDSQLTLHIYKLVISLPIPSDSYRILMLFL